MNTDRQSSPLSQLYGQIYDAGDKIGQLTEFMSDHADHLFGPAPKAASAETVEEPVVSGILGELFAATNRLHSLIHRAEEAFERNRCA